MTLDGLATALLQGAAVVLLAVLGVRLSTRIGVPGLLLFLFLGLVGGLVLPDLQVDPQSATVFGYAALVVILAEGGLTTRLDEVRPVLLPAVALATVGVFVSIVLVAVPLVLVLGLEMRTAVLLGAVLAATDAAAVFSVLRRLHLRPRLRGLLEAEAGFNDAPVIVLITVVVGSTAAAWAVPLLVLLELLGGALVGVAAGAGGRWLMPRLALPAAGLYPIAVLALIAGAYGAADLLHSSGFLAAYLAALLVGNAPQLPHRRSVVGFAEGLAWAAQIGLFFMLGLLAAPGGLVEALPAAAVAGLALLLLARPVAAAAALAPFRLPRSWLAFTGFAGLRGAVPIVFAAIPLGAGVPQARLVFDATLVLVVLLTLFQTPLLPLLSRRLGVARGVSPDELEVEAAPLDRLRASLLGFDVPDGSMLAGTYVADLRLPKGSAVALIVRDGQPQVPDRHTRLRVGDQLLVVATDDQAAAVTRRLRRVSERGRLAGWYED